MRFFLTTLCCINLTAASDLEGQVTEYVRNNAGKAFEFMLEVCEEDRTKAGLPSIETVRKVRYSYCTALAALYQ
jgi:hypothetical protein